LTEIATGKRVFVLALLGVSVVGTLLYSLHVAFDLGGSGVLPFWDDWVYHVVLFSAAAACLARGVFVRAERGGWTALGIGVALWALADVYWTVELADRERIPYPSIADAFYLAFYPFAYAGIILIVRARVPRFEASQWLDGAIGALAVAALGTALLAPTLIDVGGRNTGAVITNLAYPLGDLLLMSFVIGAVVLTVRQPGATPGREWALLGGGLLVTAIADAIYLHLEATSSYVGGTLLDSMWLVGMILIGGAAWAQTRPAPLKLGVYNSLLLPCVFATVAVGLMAAEVVALTVGGGSDIPTLALALATATLALVVARLFIAFGENARLLQAVQRESVTDSLTGLGNRRLLLSDLHQLLSPTGGRPETMFALFDLDGFKAYNDSFGHSAGDLLLKRFGKRLTAAVRPAGAAYRLGGDEFCVVASGKELQKESVLAAAVGALTEKGEGFTIRSSHGWLMLPDEAKDPTTALRVADHRMYAHKGRRAESAGRQAHDVLVRLLSEREPELSDHLQGVARLAVDLGRALELDAEEMDILARAAELHDVGKMAIPDEVIHKQGPLDSTEWDLVRSHTIIGQRILEAAAAMAPVARVVRSTHERWDGAGYPDGLAGNDIPLAARIVFVCDAFDAMTSDRPYRQALDVEEALEELQRNAGTQFDPALVELFCARLGPATTGATQAASG